MTRPMTLLACQSSPDGKVAGMTYTGSEGSL